MSIHSHHPLHRTLQLLLALATALALVVGAAAEGVTDDDDDDDAGTGEVVVKLAPGVRIGAVNAAYGTRTVDTLLSSRDIHLLAPTGADRPEDLVEALEDDRRVRWAEENLVGAAPENAGHFYAFRGHFYAFRGEAVGGANRTTMAEQPGVGLIGLDAVRDRATGTGTTVAVLDTGVHRAHPALAGVDVAAGYDLVDDDGNPADDGDGVDGDDDGQVDEAVGHGTAVAAMASLAAPDARILPLRVLDSDGLGDAFLVAEAIRMSLERGADVINLSFSTGAQVESELLEDLIEEAEESGVVVVAAAGNGGDGALQFPAAAEDVVAVTAAGRDGALADFATRGAWVDVAAPGSGIVASRHPGGGYATWSGSSFAAPFVAGQAALLAEERPGLSASDTVAVIRGSASPLPGIGGGLVDVPASLDASATGGDGGDGDDDDDDDGDDD